MQHILKQHDVIKQDYFMQQKPYFFSERIVFKAGEFFRTLSKELEYGFNYQLKTILVRYGKKYKTGSTVSKIDLSPTIELSKSSSNLTYQDTPFSPDLISAMDSSDNGIYEIIDGKLMITAASCLNFINTEYTAVFSDSFGVNVRIKPQTVDIFVDVVFKGVSNPEKTVESW